MIDYDYIQRNINDDGAIKSHILQVMLTLPIGTLYKFPPPQTPHLLLTLQRIFTQMNMDYHSVNNPTRLGFMVTEVKEEPKIKKKK